ncbi:cache domain-containing protein [Paenibacillus taichungensis]|uniref:cache domain-containing protein n=1 Tax=Paenibacillus taichungensis TaxID=484184 RepID=UPI0038CF6341
MSYIKTFTSLHSRTPRDIVITDLDDNHLSRFFSPTKRLQRQKFLIIDEKGAILFDSVGNEWTGDVLPSPQLPAKRNLYNEGVEKLSIYDQEHLITFVRMDSLPWTIISLTPMDALVEPVMEMNRLLLVIIIVYLLVSIYAAFSIC